MKIKVPRRMNIIVGGGRWRQGVKFKPGDKDRGKELKIKNKGKGMQFMIKAGGLSSMNTEKIKVGR